MGTGIAEVCARAELEVILIEVDEATADAARVTMRHSLDRAVQRDKLDATAADEAARRLTCLHDITALADREIVIEAVVEARDAKLAIFEQLRDVVENRDAILASNTSSIPIVEIATATGDRADHVLGLHFFNPVPVLSLVEIVPSLLTSNEVTERAHAFAADQLGKDPIVAPTVPDLPSMPCSSLMSSRR